MVLVKHYGNPTYSSCRPGRPIWAINMAMLVRLEQPERIGNSTAQAPHSGTALGPRKTLNWPPGVPNSRPGHCVQKGDLRWAARIGANTTPRQVLPIAALLTHPLTCLSASWSGAGWAVRARFGSNVTSSLICASRAIPQRWPARRGYVRGLRVHPAVIEHLPDVLALGDEGDQAHLPCLIKTAWPLTLIYLGGVRVVPSYDTMRLARHHSCRQCATSPMRSVAVASVSAA